LLDKYNNKKDAVFWNATPFFLKEMYRRFGERCFPVYSEKTQLSFDILVPNYKTPRRHTAEDSTSTLYIHSRASTIPELGAKCRRLHKA
jgi:hypothetical protein